MVGMSKMDADGDLYATTALCWFAISDYVDMKATNQNQIQDVVIIFSHKDRFIYTIAVIKIK